MLNTRLTSLLPSLRHWINTNSTIITNAGSLVMTTGVNSGLGFIYWWIAARTFPTKIVGLDSAAVSAMILLGTIGMLGFGTLLITELPRKPQQANSLIMTSLITSGVVSVLLGAVFALVIPHFSSELAALSKSLTNILIFSGGVGLTALTLVLDNALIGLLRGGVQLWRNFLFAASKLLILLVVGVALPNKADLNIYFTWLIGNIISLGALVLYLIWKKTHVALSFDWHVFRSLGKSALAHHALNLALFAPGMALPIIVTITLSASMNASFYASWMIVTFVFVLPSSLTTTLHAVGAAVPELLTQKIRLTLKLSFLGGVAVNVVLFITAGLVLSLFGKNYADQAAWCLRILALAVFPIIIKVHYVTICRVYDRIGEATWWMTLGGVLELVFAAIGASMGGLTGLAIGWALANTIQALYTLPVVYQVVFPAQSVLENA